jgi:hypothetical protein
MAGADKEADLEIADRLGLDRASGVEDVSEDRDALRHRKTSRRGNGAGIGRLRDKTRPRGGDL